MRLLPALVVAGVICAAGFGLQAVALDRPTDIQLKASAVLRKLLGYQTVRSSEVINGRRVNAVCVEGFVRVGHRIRPGELLTFGDGARLLVVGRRLRPLDKRALDGGAVLARVRLILAGCPNQLAVTLGRRLRFDRPIEARPSLIDAERALRFRFGARAFLFVARDDLLPLELRVVTRRYRGWSDVEPSGLGPRGLIG